MQKKTSAKRNSTKIFEFLPAVIALFLVLILRGNEILISSLIILVMLTSFKIKYYKGEWTFFLVGMIIGSFVEWFGDQIYQLQYWEQASFFGLPLWLPLFWGFMAVFIRRVGNLIVKAP